MACRRETGLTVSKTDHFQLFTGKRRPFVNLKPPVKSEDQDGSIGVPNVTLAILIRKIAILPRTHANFRSLSF